MDANTNEKLLDQRATQVLVSGYCHRNQKLLESFSSSIPDAIIEIIVRFYRISAIINIAVGQCGNQMLMEYLKSLAAEYAIDTKTGKALSKKSLSRNTYLRYDSATKTSCARSLCVDLDPGIEHILKSSEAYPLLDIDNLCMGNSGVNNNWAKAYLTEGLEFIDDFMDILRKEIESHAEPQAIQFMHNLGGGTGSGMGSLMMTKAKDEFPDLPIISFSATPPYLQYHARPDVEPYNTVLGIHQLQEHCDGIFMINNEAVKKLLWKTFAMNEPRLNNLIFVANQMVNDVTSLFRYDDSIGFNVSSFLNEMTITPHLKYLTFSRAPFYDETGALLKGESNDNDLSVLTKSLFDVKRSYTDDHFTKQGVPLSTLVAYRGFDSIDHRKIVKTVQDEISGIVPFASQYKAFPYNVMSTSICCDGAYGIDSGFMISNNTSIKSIFHRTSRQFGSLFSRKWSLLRYKVEGMDEREFREAAECVHDLIQSYEEVEKAAGK